MRHCNKGHNQIKTGIKGKKYDVVKNEASDVIQVLKRAKEEKI